MARSFLFLVLFSVVVFPFHHLLFRVSLFILLFFYFYSGTDPGVRGHGKRILIKC